MTSDNNIKENLRIRYEYYTLRILECKKDGLYTRIKEYKAKLSVVYDLIKEVEMSNGKIGDFYFRKLPQLRDEMLHKYGPAELENIPFPDCAELCTVITVLGAGECDSVCPNKHKEGQK